MFHPKGIILKRQKHLLGKLNKDIRLAGAKKREIEIGVAIGRSTKIGIVIRMKIAMKSLPSLPMLLFSTQRTF